jgi:hypothetical protein
VQLSWTRLEVWQLEKGVLEPVEGQRRVERLRAWRLQRTDHKTLVHMRLPTGIVMTPAPGDIDWWGFPDD